MIKEVMERTGLGGCKLYVTEWNNTVSNRNYLNDSCFRAAYAARKIEEIWDEVDLICPWTGSDWVSSYYDTRGLANGGNGFLTKDTVRKPVFFAFQFLNDLGDKLIAKNEHCIITQKGQNYYIVCFNFKSYGCNYFLDEESMDSPDHLKELFENKDPLDLEIVLENMPESVTYIITCRTINEENGSFLDEWKKFQYDHQMTGADVKYVRESCFPCMSRERREVKNGTLSIKKTLLPHEISLFHIYED